MLRQRIFIKKTKRGKVLKIVREHYLRDDVGCGLKSCNTCEHNEYSALQLQSTLKSIALPRSHVLVPDTNVILHQMDVLEHQSVTNVIILQTVIEEVKHRSAPIYKRLRDLIAIPEKHFYLFVNEFHKDTYTERLKHESSNDRNDRAIRLATSWYQQHLRPEELPVVLLTNDRDNKEKASKEGLTVFTIHEYIKGLENCAELIDKLAQEGISDENRKKIFDEHLPLSEIQRRLKSGQLVQGKFHASRENYLEGSVALYDADESVFLQGHAGLNRAVNGDVVAVRILDEAQWSAPSALVMVDDEEKADVAAESQAERLQRRKPAAMKLKTGVVVGIIKRNWRPYCGILQRSLVAESVSHLFVPAERAIPKIRVVTRQAAKLEGQRIVVAIDSWPCRSRYPQGHLVRALGDIGDKDTENEVLLLEHDIPHAAFSRAVLKCLPELPWKITRQDEKARVDLRHLPICSVDPPGCTDIDDALHCLKLSNGNLEVGVHIADVTHFIRPGTAIDEEAAHRSTTVYLIDKRIDMVPDLLSSNLCSLRGGEERFAFSVIWEMTGDAEIVATKFHKSIIKSKAALTYAEAQMRIDDPNQKDECTLGLRLLNGLAKILKKRRIDNGALTLASTEIRFHIDSETHDPIDVAAKELRETNSMVEEFMLLANVAVAQKILNEFPDCAMLRRHPEPPPSNYKPIVQVSEAKGFKMNIGTGKALAESLEAAQIPGHPYFNVMLRILTTRCMMQASYFCSGTLPADQYHHYGLAAAIYTHFTSPIRRYADVMVHRLLAIAINADTSFPELKDKDISQKLSVNMNHRHKMAQYAGRASVKLHTQIFFRNRILDEQGYVLFVRQNALQILIPKYGLEGTVFLPARNETPKFVYNEQESTQSCGAVCLHIFDPVTVQISIDSRNIQHQKLLLKLVEPVIEGFSISSASAQAKRRSECEISLSAQKRSKLI